jgi:hypothetical protein
MTQSKDLRLLFLSDYSKSALDAGAGCRILRATLARRVGDHKPGVPKLP